jgi:hypothetical protein
MSLSQQRAEINEFDVITAVMIQSHVVWGITPYLLVNIYRLFGGHFCFSLQSVR